LSTIDLENVDFSGVWGGGGGGGGGATGHKETLIKWKS